MAGVDETDKADKLKAALWYEIGNIVDAIALDQEFNATPQFIGSLTELVWNQIISSAEDLEVFAKHAGRTTVDTKDVMLLARRNKDLQQALQDAMMKMPK